MKLFVLIFEHSYELFTLVYFIKGYYELFLSYENMNRFFLGCKFIKKILVIS